MLAIRMQRTGRRGHAMFRVIVQDSRRTPTSGKVVARLGSYDPHNKAIILDKEKASFYLDHGAQPSDRVARLLKNEGVKLPDWVSLSVDKERAVRHADKRRSTRPADAAPSEPTAAPTAAGPAAQTEEAPAETAETPAETPETETPEVAPEEAESPEAAELAADDAPADEAKPAEDTEPAKTD